MTTQRATKRTAFPFRLLPHFGTLLIAMLIAPACSPEPMAMNAPDPGLPQPPGLQSFYETNPTYTSNAPDDGFWKMSTPESQYLDSGALAAADLALAQIPSSFSLLVIRNGYLVHESYFHGSHARASNNIHSASKSILSALVGIALDRGYLKGLDQTVAELLPNHRMKDAATASITLRNLLAMTSGLSWVEDDTEYDIEQTSNWVQAILDLPVSSKPGSKFNYSTGNAHLLSAILTQATGQPLPDFATRELFAPLGITYEHWGKDPQGIASGGYNFYATPRALARFALMVENGGVSQGRQLVPAAWLDSSLKPQEPASTGYHYGYLYWLPKVGRYQVAEMWGYGGQFAYVIPDADLLVVLTNNTHESYPEPDGDAFVQKYILPAILK
jgi:CubicO group peptidase (beta-lactamase class C family)